MSNSERTAGPDVVVVGGGPVGLAAGLALAQEGAQVTICEARSCVDSGALDKACGEGLMPDGIAALRSLGVAVDDLGRQIRGISYIDPHSRAQGRFPDAPGRGIRRTQLHRRLLDHIHQHANVEILYGTRAELRRDSSARGPFTVRVDPTATTAAPAASRTSVLEPRWVVGADGLRSPLRRQAGLELESGNGRGRDRRNGWRRIGARRHFEVPPWSDRVEVYWARGVEAYVTPVDDDCVGVALLWSDTPDHRPPFDQRLEEMLDGFPQLRERLRHAQPCSRVRGAGPLRQRTRTPVSENLVLVGDAAGYHDAITGEGLSLGFADAVRLGRCWEQRGQKALADYARDRHRRSRRASLLIHGALLLSRRPRLRQRVLLALARNPRTFDRLLAAHVGERSLVSSFVPLLAALVSTGFGLPRGYANRSRSSS